jgi:hypothetical protein
MDDVILVKGDDEADAMLLCAVQWVMHEEVEKLIEKFGRLVPPHLGDQFVDYIFEAKYVPTRLTTDNEAGSPDLRGDEAYRDYVRKVMGVTE